MALENLFGDLALDQSVQDIKTLVEQLPVPPDAITGFATEAKQLPDGHGVVVNDVQDVVAQKLGGFNKNVSTYLSITEAGTTTTITETDGARTLTTTINESTNPITISKVWS